jgi:hypothetical protein
LGKPRGDAEGLGGIALRFVQPRRVIEEQIGPSHVAQAQGALLQIFAARFEARDECLTGGCEILGPQLGEAQHAAK